MKTIGIIAFLCLSLTLVPSVGRSQIATHVVISEVYGGGGNSGATYKNDYVELYNPTGALVVMTDWSIQYASATGSFGSANKTKFSGLIPSHGFFLVQEAQGAGGTVALPTPDAIGLIAMSSSNGKVALASDTNTVSGPTSANVVDFVGYGTANMYEGSGAVSALSNTTSAERKAQSTSTAASMSAGGADETLGNGWDSNNNGGDFVIRTSPEPQNTASPLEAPPVVGNSPPIISNLTRSTFVPAAGGIDSITASIVDVDGVIVGARLHVAVNHGAVDSSIAMTFTSGTQYAAVIPAGKHVSNGDLVEYFVSAVDDSSLYSSTASAMQGYFVGDAPISSIKAQTLSAIAGYAARVNGTMNVNTNLFMSSPGQGFVQDATGGLQLYQAGGLPGLSAGRNTRIQGTIIDFSGAYEMTAPGLAFVDTALGTTTLTPETITLPTTESASFNKEGKLVKIAGLSTDSTGSFAAPRSYPFHTVSGDTITVRVESNAGANTLVGKPIPSSPIDIIGVLSFANGYQRLKPRGSVDVGGNIADGSGTAAITPTTRVVSASAVAETLTVTGDGTSTLEGISVAVPSTWTWTDTSATSLSGAGFSGGVRQVTGDGSGGNPYVVTITGAAVTNTNTGTLIVRSLTTPAAGGPTTFLVKTRGVSGTLSNIASSPIVTISTSGFEAIASGNWSSPSTWSGGNVPGPSDDVTMTTLSVTVTIDIADAQCNNLTISGGGSVPSTGPVLRFSPSGTPQLTVNGNLSISGGSGGGGGDRGGRGQLTSNGNASATLIVKHSISTSPSNSSANGNAGLNMNEGTVRLTGGSTDSLKNNAGFRLGNLSVGDGSNPKTLVWVPTHVATMVVRSLTVKTGSTFWIGAANDTTANHIGNAFSSGLPTLTGGITVESGAALRVQDVAAGTNVASINIDGGSIVNNGTLSLAATPRPAPKSGKLAGVLAASRYVLTVGGLTAGAPTGTIAVGGSQPGQYADVLVAAGDTLTLNQDMVLGTGTLTLNGTLVESPGNTVMGTAVASRVLSQSVSDAFGGIGVTIDAAGASPDSTTVTRTTGVALSGGGNSSILRYYDVAPKVNSGLNAAFDLAFDDSELNGHTAATLQLWQSTDNGTSWMQQAGSVDPVHRKLHADGVNSFRRWTAADAAHPLGINGRRYVLDHAGWNMVSIPLTVSDFRKEILFPTAISRAFGYTTSYVIKDTLEQGRGYWLKFANADTISFTGAECLQDTIPVKTGWNMIGTVSDTVTSIFKIPPEMNTSQFFGYTSGYFIATRLVPAVAYWVKVDRDGYLVLVSGSPAQAAKISPPEMNRFSSITVTDRAGETQTLYLGSASDLTSSGAQFELPPAPPEGTFDVRFASGRFAEAIPAEPASSHDYSLVIRTDAYPITISWKMTLGGERSAMLVARSGFGQPLAGEGSVRIDRPMADPAIRIAGNTPTPVAYALGANYPNPFNPSTKFMVAVPELANVEISVFDLLGRKVCSLANGMMNAGYHAVEWNGVREDGSAATSGVYFVRMTARAAAGGGEGAGGFSAVTRIIMMK